MNIGRLWHILCEQFAKMAVNGITESNSSIQNEYLIVYYCAFNQCMWFFPTWRPDVFLEWSEELSSGQDFANKWLIIETLMESRMLAGTDNLRSVVTYCSFHKPVFWFLLTVFGSNIIINLFLSFSIDFSCTSCH